MSRGVPKELEDEIRTILGQLVNAEPGTFISTSLSTGSLEFDAMRYLEDIGAFERVGSGSFRVTANGRDYWENLTAPRWNWFRRNWFPASVAAGTILFSGVSAAVNIANLVA